MNGKEHRQADELLLGYDVPGVHVCMDAWSETLGSQHRQLGHIYQFVEAMELIFGRSGKTCALLHIFLDLDIIDSKFIKSQFQKKKRKSCHMKK